MRAPLEVCNSPAPPAINAAFYRALVENSWDAMEVLDADPAAELARSDGLK